MLEIPADLVEAETPIEGVHLVPVCSECGDDLRETTDDYELVEIGGENYNKITRKCTNCNTRNYYYRDMALDKIYSHDDLHGEENKVKIEEVKINGF